MLTAIKELMQTMVVAKKKGKKRRSVVENISNFQFQINSFK